MGVVYVSVITSSVIVVCGRLSWPPISFLVHTENSTSCIVSKCTMQQLIERAVEQDKP